MRRFVGSACTLMVLCSVLPMATAGSPSETCTNFGVVAQVGVRNQYYACGECSNAGVLVQVGTRNFSCACKGGIILQVGPGSCGLARVCAENNCVTPCTSMCTQSAIIIACPVVQVNPYAEPGEPWIFISCQGTQGESCGIVGQPVCWAVRFVCLEAPVNGNTTREIVGCQTQP
jgi:hypothetical protein